MPNNALDTLKQCDGDFFPNIRVLLLAFVVTPTTSCEPERVFSELKRIKSVLRSTTGQDRLNHLLLLKMHPDIPINLRQVVQTVLSTEEMQD